MPMAELSLSKAAAASSNSFLQRSVPLPARGWRRGRISRPRKVWGSIVLSIDRSSGSGRGKHEAEQVRQGLGLGLGPLQALAADVQGLATQDVEVEKVEQPVPVPDPDVVEVQEMIRSIQSMLRSLGDGEISGSPYDAAWVAMVPAVGGGAGPQFPAALEWVVRCQLPDGCWAGDAHLFNLYDRMVATLVCVLALQTWSAHPDAARRGCAFIREHVHQLDLEDKVHRTVGFEMVFPAILERARAMGLDLPYDAPAVTFILEERERKLKQIPVQLLQAQPTTLLASLEGMDALEGIDWDKIRRLQSPSGHMLTSPASTACLYMHTRDGNALDYLSRLVESTGGVIPNHSPVDIFERLWIVDRLQRLGIARHFKPEIKDILDFAFQRWTQRGLSWATDCNITDLDDTSMGFRLLRQHGYPVSADVFKSFCKGVEFSCWIDHGCDLDTDVTPMFNLHRASQMRFPDEDLLEDAWNYTRFHLEEKQQQPHLSDRWVVSKDLRGELEYALNWPWYASFPRLETRAYIDQYGPDDVWIAKSLYRMYGVCNSAFLSLAKADFNVCQNMYRAELEALKEWVSECRFDRLRFARHHTVIPGFLCSASTSFEPEMAAVRRARTQFMFLATMADDYTTLSGAPQEELDRFQAATQNWDPSMIDHTNLRQRIVFMGIYDTVVEIAETACNAQGRDVSRHVVASWQRYAESVRVRAEWRREGTVPAWDQFIPVGAISIGMEICSLGPSFLIPGVELSDEAIQSEYHDINMEAGTVVRLLNDVRSYQSGIPEINSMVIHMRDHPEKSEEEAARDIRGIVDSSMKQLVQHVFTPSSAPMACKHVFLDNAKTAYYLYTDTDGWTSPSAKMQHHLNQLLFNRVL